MAVWVRRLVGLLLAAAWTLAAAAAQAHPDVRIASASQLIYAPDGSVTGVRHAWTFDETFTRGALEEVESKTKGVYTREELAPLARINAESLKEFGYFTFAKADGKTARFNGPVDYFMEYTDGALTLHFTLPLRTPVKPKELVIEVFDASFFADFQFAETGSVRLVGAPAACNLDIARRPQGGAPGAGTGNEPPLADAEHDDSGTVFANRITVTCP